MKAFYSWQSDTPNAIGKDFIRDALDSAVEKIAADIDLDNAERPIEIDQDTAGVLGDPEIASTIFSKIDLSDLIIVDVTLTGKTESGKRLINSNVAYELGYAHKSLSDVKIIKIMNEHYGGPNKLPFDLKHRRWPTRFKLSPNAGQDAISSEKSKLVDLLSPILREYLTLRNAANTIVKGFSRARSTTSPSMFWETGTSLVTQNSTSFSFPDTAKMYLRVSPTKSFTPPRLSKIKNSGTFHVNSAPLGREYSGSLERNKYGLIVFEREFEGDKLLQATQILKSGEIWGINTYYLESRPDTNMSSKPENFIPSKAVEKAFQISLSRYIKFMKSEFGYDGRITVEAGITGVEGFSIAMPQSYFRSFWGPIYDNEIIIQREIDPENPASVKAFLLDLFEDIYDASGTSRPESLYDFPEVKT